jgi:hypothetical protein
MNIPKNHRWAIIIGVVIIGCVAGAQWLRRSASPPKRELPAMVRAGEGIDPLELKLLASPHISHKGYIFPHSGPVFGENSYVYSGKIEIAGKPFKVRLDDYEPIAAVRFQKVTYLLVRAYFWKEYGLRRLESDGKLVVVPATVLDRSFGLMKFVAPLECYYYRIWWMTALAKANRAADVVEYFNGYVHDDPRWVFPDGKEGTELEDFLKRTRDQPQYDGMVGSLQAIIEHSRPADNGQVFRHACLALMHLSSDEGTRFVREFERRVRAEGEARDDSRIEALDVIHGLLYAPTSGPSTSTRPTSAPAQPPTPPPPRRQ